MTLMQVREALIKKNENVMENSIIGGKGFSDCNQLTFFISFFVKLNMEKSNHFSGDCLVHGFTTKENKELCYIGRILH